MNVLWSSHPLSLTRAGEVQIPPALSHADDGSATVRAAHHHHRSRRARGAGPTWQQVMIWAVTTCLLMMRHADIGHGVVRAAGGRR